jgi:succinate dehydrogenase / fumarate reductase flavoprotein subunit
MQGLADGYFILPYTIGDYLARAKRPKPDPDSAPFRQAEKEVRDGIRRLIEIPGKHPVDVFHRELGKLLWDHCGMTRSAKSLEYALQEIPRIRERFWREARVTGGAEEINLALERAGRVADFLEFAELMCLDALERRESCGGHFREEFQTEDGEAKRDDEHFCHVAAWEYRGAGERPQRHIEPLRFEFVQLATRSYK